MKLVREPTNRYDRYAVMVVAPPKCDINPEVLDKVTRGRSPAQRVRDVAGGREGEVGPNLSVAIYW